MSRKRVVPVVVVAVAAVSVAVWLMRRGDDGEVLAASGTVEATDADLGFGIAGRIAVIEAREGDRVRAGQVLARLDDAELQARSAAAEAQLAAARALLAELEGGARPEELAQVRAAERAAAERLEDAQRDVERARRLLEGGAISQEALDKAETMYEVAVSAHDQAREQRQLVEAGPRRERLQAQRAVVRQAQAAVDQVAAALRHSVVEAPFDGLVTVRHRNVGETVAPGQPVLTVMDPDDRWIRIYVPENQVGRVSLGQDAEISADSYPDRTYGGRVVFIASEAEFTPRNVQTPEERVKLVYAVRVEVTGDPELELKPGLPADVRIPAAGG